MRYALFTLLMTSCFMSMGQKHDNNWLWGFTPGMADSTYVGQAQGDWSNDTFRSYPKYHNAGFSGTSEGWSDAEGNLLCYTNGMWIQDATGQMIENGDSIGFDVVWQANRSAALLNQGGYPGGDRMLWVNKPDNDSVIFYFYEVLNDFLLNQNSVLAYAVIVRTAAGTIKVATKNNLATTLHPANVNLSACKHANGRDWWILFVENNTNCMVKLLLTPDTLLEYNKQCIGDSVIDGYGYKSTFSMDGTKYSNSCYLKGINIFDFDRCTGQLSNPQHISPLLQVVVEDTATQLTSYLSSVEFSPDNNLFYTIVGTRIFQYNLNSPLFPNDRYTVALWDTFMDTVPGACAQRFVHYNSHYGPDGIIYTNPGCNQRFLCTINNPNGIGAACDFRMRNVVLPKMWYRSMTNAPNYRLGRLIGSACDTVYSDVKPIYKESPWLKVYPNPAKDEVKLDYNWVEWEKYKDVRCEILDLRGTAVMQVQIPRYSSWQMVSVKGLVSGVYTVALQDGEKRIAVCKLVKVE